jgi:RNA polymerase sigma-70 factor (ECF subfamily)
MNAQITTLIQRACEGDSDALGQLLEQHRPYLRMLAQRMLDARVTPRIDASDVVQQTCLSVYRKIADFQGDQTQFLAWLRQIHERNIQNAYRDHVQLQKRSVQREQTVDQTAWSVSQLAPSLTSSPSQRLMMDERSVQLAAAIDQLTDEQATAIRLKFLEGCPVREVAHRMDRSVDAVGALIRRGLVQLKKILEGSVS